MRRVITATALALAVALAASACTPDSRDLEASDSPVARYDWDPNSGGDAALAEGTLQLIDGCLYIVAADDSRVLPVFSRALAAWDASADMLIYGGMAYDLGDSVAAGGGWGPPTDDMTIPEACEPDSSGDVFHVQSTALD